MDEIEYLKERISALDASRVAETIILASLMATHPQYEQMQIFLTRLLEKQLGDGALGSGLTDHQKHQVRETVEWLQTAKRLQPNQP